MLHSLLTKPIEELPIF